MSRWSSAKYRNPDVASYVPPETFLVSEGDLLGGLEMRAELADFNRILAEGLSDDYIQGYGWQIQARFDSQGRRVNLPVNILEERKDNLLNRIKDFKKRHRARHDEAAQQSSSRARLTVRFWALAATNTKRCRTSSACGLSWEAAASLTSPSERTRTPKKSRASTPTC